jgi:tetratricopeptide (TPR) repeat protein
MSRARCFFEQALALDPENIDAMLGLASVDVTVGAALMTDDWATQFAAAEATSTKVLSLAPNHALAHLVLGVCQMFTKRVAQGIAECEHALLLDRNLANAHCLIGTANIFLVEARKPKLTSTRRCAFRLATPLPIDGSYGWPSPRCISISIMKR